MNTVKLVKRLTPVNTLPTRVVRATHLRVYRRFLPRRIHAYCVGMLKSGTHSVAGLFLRHYRAFHEPNVKQIVDAVMAEKSAKMNEMDRRDFVRARDRRLWLEFDSSAFNVFFLDTIVQEFPEAKFILPIRDCYSWVDSVFNHKRGREVPVYLQAFLSHWFRAPSDCLPEEKPLLQYNLFPLTTYLKAWERHNRYVIDTVPNDRLLVVRTNDIAHSLPEIARFLEIPVETLDYSRSHSFRAPRKFGTLLEMDTDFVDRNAQEICGDLMQQYFPDIKTVGDAVRR